jgi:hypothetical protein
MVSPDQKITTLVERSLGINVRPLLEGHLPTRNTLERCVAHALGNMRSFYYAIRPPLMESPFLDT